MAEKKMATGQSGQKEKLVCQNHTQKAAPCQETSQKNTYKFLSQSWDYQDKDGKPIIQVRRYDPPGESKTFRQFTKSKGKWTPGLNGVEPVIYRLPEIIKSENIFLVEGEKCADALVELGLVATTNLGGANKWLPQYTDALKDKNVVFIPDNDEPGMIHRDLVRAKIIDHVKSLKIVGLPVKEKQDVYDWIYDLKSSNISNGDICLKLADIIEKTEPEKNTSHYLKLQCLEILRQQESEKFNTEHLPPIIGKYITEHSKSTNSDPIILASSVYGMLSGMIGKRIFMENGNYFQRLYSNLWMLSASSSGSFKTTGLNKGARIAYKFESYIRDKIEIRADELGQLENDSKRATVLKKEILDLEAEIPVLPNRTTTEGLIDTLKNGQAGTIFLSEFGDWLRAMEQSYNSGLKPFFTDIYDVPESRTQRTRTLGSVNLKFPFVSICAVSTLNWIKNNISVKDDIETGFFARFLIFYPPQNDQIPPSLPPIITDNTREIEVEIEDILNHIQETNFKLSAKSSLYFNHIHNEMYKKIYAIGDSTRDLLAPYLKRWSPYILKLAMINQCFIEPGTNKISMEALFGAKSLVEYAINSTIYLFQNDLGESEHQGKCRKVIEYLARKGGSVNRMTLLGSKQLTGGVKEYDYIIENLIEAGKISAKNETGKKKFEEYIICGENKQQYQQLEKFEKV
jgi:hypothetical protein